jgi:hypothetical protein
MLVALPVSSRNTRWHGIGGILRHQMDQAIDEHLDRMAALDVADRRNGSYSRHLLTELGRHRAGSSAHGDLRRAPCCGLMHGVPSRSTA